MLSGAYTQNISYFSTVTTQHKSWQRRVRRVLMMRTARRREDAQGAQFRRFNVLISIVWKKNEVTFK